MCLMAKNLILNAVCTWKEALNIKSGEKDQVLVIGTFCLRVLMLDNTEWAL